MAVMPALVFDHSKRDCRCTAGPCRYGRPRAARLPTRSRARHSLFGRCRQSLDHRRRSSARSGGGLQSGANEARRFRVLSVAILAQRGSAQPNASCRNVATCDRASLYRTTRRLCRAPRRERSAFLREIAVLRRGQCVRRAWARLSLFRTGNLAPRRGLRGNRHGLLVQTGDTGPHLDRKPGPLLATDPHGGPGQYIAARAPRGHDAREHAVSDGARVPHRHLLRRLRLVGRPLPVPHGRICLSVHLAQLADLE